jgi:hypothetical protein
VSAALRLNFDAVPAQSDAWKVWKPGCRIGNAWGRGTGKSWFARMLMYLLVIEWDGAYRPTSTGRMRGVRIFYMFPTLKHFKRLGHAQKMLDELGPKGEFGFLNAEIDRTEWTFRFPGGSYIQILSAEVSNRGARADAALLDEADEIPLEIFEAEIGPWFTEPWSLKQVLVTGTPKLGRFGLLWKAYSVWPRGDIDFQPLPHAYGFHATVYDANPRIVDHAEAERAKTSINPTRFATEYLCSFDSAEGLVYPFFELDFHVRTPPDISEFRQYIVGVDHGFNDPTVFLVIGLAGSGADTICHVVREYYLVGKSASELVTYAQEIEQDFPGARWYADHNPAVNKQLHDDAGVKIQSAEKGAGSVERGAAVVADAVFVREELDERSGLTRRWSQLYVTPGCKHTIDEFGKYRWQRDARNPDIIYNTIDTSKDDHCMDALRYALVSHFVGPEKAVERPLKLRRR